jgi:putative ABC transport system ATP-binding protein
VGQQQRVAAARALIGDPDIVIADEPTSALDFDTRERFVDLLFERLEETNATLVFVSHDPTLGARFKREAGIDEFRAKAVA